MNSPMVVRPELYQICAANDSGYPKGVDSARGSVEKIVRVVACPQEDEARPLSAAGFEGELSPIDSPIRTYVGRRV